VNKVAAGWWDYTAAVLLATVPVLAYVKYQQLGIFSVDVLGLLVPALAIGLAAGWMVHRAPRWLRNIFLALLTLGFVDLQFNLEARFSFWIVTGASFLIVGLLWEHYARVATVFLLGFLAALPLRSSSLAIRTWRSEQSAGAGQPSRLVPVVHIVLDEHAAPRAFPPDVAEADRARDGMLNFYRRHGFRLYTKAYSRYFWTHSAIPAVLSPLARADRTTTVVEPEPWHYLLTSSQLFAWAKSRGYRIHVVQTDFLDVCSRQRHLLASCRTSPVNSAASLSLLALGATNRMLLQQAYFLSAQSYLFRRITRGWRPHMLQKANVGMALAELAQLRRSIGEDLGGSWYFAHLLVPHFPYEVDSACGGRPWRERLGAGWTWAGGVWGNTMSGRRIRWALYSAQVECLYTQLEGLIATIDSVAPPQGVLVVLHGDHGSRILRTMPDTDDSAKLTNQDLLDGFATLLAVRGPGIQAGVDSSAEAIQVLVPRLILNDSLGSKAPGPPVVFLEHYGPLGHPMLRFSAAVLGQ
jgi:hypothetical protein